MVYVTIVLEELKKRIKYAPNGEARDALKAFESWVENFLIDDLEKMHQYIEEQKQKPKNN